MPDACECVLGDEKCALGGVIRTGLCAIFMGEREASTGCFDGCAIVQTM